MRFTGTTREGESEVEVWLMGGVNGCQKMESSLNTLAKMQISDGKASKN